MRIGSMTITSLVDGEMSGPLGYFYPDDDVSELTGLDRMFDPVSGNAIISIGSYLIQGGGRVVLVDAGAGPRPKSPPVAGGALRSALLAAGVDPGEITDVVFTHLHFDHIGWATHEGAPFFANATYHCDRRDWDHFMSPAYDVPDWEQRATHPETDAAAVRLAPVADRMSFWEGDAEVLPGISAIDAAGHTPGTCALVIESAGERGLLLGDIVHTQPELLYAWRFRTHDDPVRAVKQIVAIRSLLADEDIPCSGSHFPGLSWGKV
ncbi:MAG TPA: MBL fold metallo-hydrolase, partial [Amycolatopsis sp.]|nr:MBL fold metallo-hydrolase [Amycolatopsis sp.]